MRRLWRFLLSLRPWRPRLPQRSQPLQVGWTRGAVVFELRDLPAPLHMPPAEARRMAAAIASCADLAEGKPYEFVRRDVAALLGADAAKHWLN